MIDYKLSLMTGVDIPVPGECIAIHQPTLKEISIMGEDEFFRAVQLLVLNKNSILTALQQPELERVLPPEISSFDIILQILNLDKTKKDQLINLFVLVFPGYTVSFLPQSIVLIKNQEVISITKENYEVFQTIFKKIFKLELSAQGGEFNPSGKRSAEIAKKLMRARQRVAAIKSKEGKETSLDQYISIITVGVASMSLNDVINLTLYQLYDLLERFNRWTAWDIDIRSRLAGAKIDKPMENWMKPIH